MSRFSVDRETKVISAILFIAALSLVGAYYLDRQYFVDWSDLEKEAEYNETVAVGGEIVVRYYLVNNDPHEVKVEPKLSYGLSIYYASNPENRTTGNINKSPAEKYITIPAHSRRHVHTEQYTANRTGNLVIQLSGLPEARIDILPKYIYNVKLNSEPLIVRGGNCYYAVNITILNEGMSDINVKLHSVRICDISYFNMTVDDRGYEIVPDYAEYVLVPVSGTQCIRYVTEEVVHGSIFYVRIKFTLHIRELDKMEIISTWLHRKLITS